MNTNFVIFLLVIASICYSSSAFELDVDSNSRHSGEIYIDNVPAESTDTVEVQPVDNIEDDSSDTQPASLLDIDTQGHENESGRKARQFFGGGGGGLYGGGRGFYGGGFYPRPYYGGGGFYGRRYGYGFGGYPRGFRYYG